VTHPVEAAPAPETPGREGVFQLKASDFQSNEVPHYFLTSGRKWLVCIDGSSESKLGLFHALNLMNVNEDHLFLVHAVKKSRSLASRLSIWRAGSSTAEAQPTAGGAPSAEPTAAQEPEPEPDSVKRGKGYLAHAGNLVKQWSDGVKWTARFIEAKDPREAICDLANEEKVDYIVMGSRGQNPIRKMFMGSVSSYVSSHAPCPVIVIRETEEQRREKRAAELEEKKVQKKTSEKTEKRKKLRKKKRDQRKAEGQLQAQQQQQQLQPQQQLYMEQQPLLQPPQQQFQQQPTTTLQQPMTVAVEEKRFEEFLPQPPIPPPVDTSLGTQGPIVPGETNIPVMDK
jgi:nucleotide-binding universal stress UspA family protein